MPMRLDRRLLLFVGCLWLVACDDESGTREDLDPVSRDDAGRRTGDAGSTPRTPDASDAVDAARGELDGSVNAELPVLSDGGVADAAIDAALPVGERLQDRRRFTIDPVSLPFFQQSGSSVETDRWYGTLEGAGYRVEVPRAWNGQLVMYAHDYQGANSALSVRTPSLRRHLIERGYAWAASSFAANYYDVRAGIEGTNALAAAFVRIAAENGRVLPEPTKRFVVGHAMGGHIAGAAVERETEASARNKVHYHAALALCGVMADLELFRYFAAYQAAAYHLSNAPLARLPASDYQTIRPAVLSALFTRFPDQTTPAGDLLRNLVRNLTGGPRPVFELGFAANEQTKLWNAFAADGWQHGILASEAGAADTRPVVYQLDVDPAVSAEEEALNRAVFRAAGDPAVANPPQPAGLRWVPLVHGEIAVPVLSLHTLGDVLVPFSMQQIYRRRTLEKGSSEWLVQRAIRAPGHCDFTLAEQAMAFDALVAWEQTGIKPDGDDVLDPAVTTAPNYGCTFTTNPTPEDEPAVQASRVAVPPCASLVAQ